MVMVVTVGKGFKIQSVYKGGLLIKINSNTIVAILGLWHGVGLWRGGLVVGYP